MSFSLPGVPLYPHPPPASTGPLYTEEDVASIQEMFPTMEEDVIKSVLESHRGNKDASITALLQMNAEN